jgi:hypothetical protein
VQELTEAVVAGVQMVGVEASHCCSATGIGPGVRINGARGGELGFLFVLKTLMQNLSKVNLHNSGSSNSPNAR